MSLHVIVGAGPVGSSVARLLAGRGERVRIVSRSGRGPDEPGIERIRADAAQAPRMQDLAEGATAIYNCARPAYQRWPADWPPLAGSLLHAAESSGAVLAITSSLHGYGPVDSPMTESMPLRPRTTEGAVRTRIWHDALEAHRAGRLRVTEVRGSDYVGAGADSFLTRQVIPKVLAGERIVVPADLDAPHSWTYVGDVARTLVAAAAEERAWGRPWNVPTAAPASIREVAQRVAGLAGIPLPPLASRSPFRVWAGSVLDPTVRAQREADYQYRRPFIVDSSAATNTFGIQPTPLDEALRATIDAMAVRTR
ncbi:MAG TPA: NAD-dependent epimerase/dehydratase family protein [Micromonosporaceae bacterium]